MTEPTIDEVKDLMHYEGEPVIDVDATEVDEHGKDVVPHNPGQPANLFHGDSPSGIVSSAVETADALKAVIQQKGLFKMIQGREHVLVEGWTLLGTMLGVFPVTVWTRKTDDGWEARVEARTLNGQVVGAAEAQCSRSENTWKSRDDYALRSMAQTRATSKALRQPLGFVMTLAGYDATPADEMPTTEHTGPPAATEKMADPGLMEEIGLRAQLLQDAYPEAATPGKTWKQTAWAYGGEKLGFSPSGPITVKQANDLREWLEEQFRQLEMADQIPSEALPKEGDPDVEQAADSAFKAPETA